MGKLKNVNQKIKDGRTINKSGWDKSNQLKDTGKDVLRKLFFFLKIVSAS